MLPLTPIACLSLVKLRWLFLLLKRALFSPPLPSVLIDPLNPRNLGHTPNSHKANRIRGLLLPRQLGLEGFLPQRPRQVIAMGNGCPLSMFLLPPLDMVLRLVSYPPVATSCLFHSSTEESPEQISKASIECVSKQKIPPEISFLPLVAEPAAPLLVQLSIPLINKSPPQFTPRRPHGSSMPQNFGKTSPPPRR